MQQQHSKQAGFSLVEILLVLGIIAILAIAAFVIFPQVQNANRANTEQSNLVAMSAGIKNLYAATRDYSSLTTAIANKAGIVPSTMNGGDSAAATITSSWSQAVSIGPGAATAVSPTFAITYTDMPAKVCAKLVPGMIQNFKSIHVPATSTAALSNDPAAVIAACGTADVDVKFVGE
ncbi:type 4 pilus major pilin [Novilysobacter arseniciresistens]|uniref:type 4 pilus major pilin n=1 Tax=Novilysobacter arseniciresistens TaxID=1385522 RepID=UPI00068AE78A|nr:type 4 pilus major pilin [Lysobacter arseniciresistens]